MLYDWQTTSLKPEDLKEGVILEADLPARKIALLKKDDQVLAFSPSCPHTGARLCEGWLDARGHIVCPLHGYRFDPSNGRNTSGEGYKLKTFPVEIRDSFIWIGIISQP